MRHEPNSTEIGCECGPGAFNPLAWWRVGVGLLIAGNSMVLSLSVSSAEVSPSEWRTIQTVLFLLAASSLVLLGWPLARNAARAAADKRLTIEAMFLTGVVGAMVGSVIAAVTGSEDSYFEVISILLVVYLFGQQLTGQVQERALQAAVRWAPELTRCLVLGADGRPTQVPVHEVRPGARVFVPPGEVIAADGIVVSGEAFVREAEMTGEPFVVVKRAGDRVWAGTHCVDAALTLVATADGRRRRIDGILDAVEQARAQPTTLQAQADRLVARFLPLVAVISACTFGLWWALDGWRAGLFCAMAVLLVACPCALGLATPLALWVTVARLSSRGLVVVRAQSVETMAAVDRVVFDKTGTLTEPRARLVDLVAKPPAGLTRDQLLSVVAAVEGSSRHPVAAAFDGLDRGGTMPWVVDDLRTIPGSGLSAHVRSAAGDVDLEIVIGAADRLAVSDLVEWQALHDQIRAHGGLREIAVLIAGRPVIAAVVDESLRSSWSEALKMLHDIGLPVLVFTGDSAERAQRTAGDEVAAGLGPEQKLGRVQALREQGSRALFMGDGVNDAAALAAADVSIAVAGGADLASEVADMVWHGTDLRVIPWAILLCRETVARMRSNLLIAAAYNLVGIGLAASGVLHPVAAALLMTFSSVVVTWRAIAGLEDDQREAEARVANGRRSPEQGVRRGGEVPA